MKSRTRFVLIGLAMMFVVLAVIWIGDLTAPDAIDSDSTAVVPEATPQVNVNEIHELADSELTLPNPNSAPGITEEELDEAEEPERDLWALLAGGVYGGRHNYELTFEVLGSLGRPLAGSFVCLGPERQPLNMIGRVGLDGKLTVKWSGHTSSMTVVYAVCGPRRSWSGLKSLIAVAGGTHHVQLTLPGEQFTIQKGKSSREGSTRRIRNGKVQSVQSQFFRSPAAVHRYGEVEFVWTDAGSAETVRASGGVASDAVAFKSQRDMSRSEALGFLRNNWDMESFALSLLGNEEPEPEVETITITGRVLDSFLEPAVGALVTVGYGEDSPFYGAKTNSNGEFSIWGVHPRVCYIWAGGGEFGVARIERGVDFDLTDVGELVLDRGVEMEGELFSKDKRPLVGWMVECEGLGVNKSESRFARTGSDGRYRLPNLPASELLLHFRPFDSRRILPSETVAVQSRHLFQTAESKGTKASYQDFEISAARSEDLAGLELRIWKENRGAWGIPRGRSAFQSIPLTEGSYRIETFSLAGGWARRTKFDKKTGPSNRPITLSLNGGGSVIFRKSRVPGRSYVLWLKGPIVNTRVVTSSSRGLGRMDLPEGEYALEVHSESKGNIVIPITILAGTEVVIEIPQ